MTDQPDLEAIEAATRHALESMVPGHLVSAALHALALIAEVRKLREALAEVPDAVGAASMQFVIILSLCMRAIDMTDDDTPDDLALASEIENRAPQAQKAMTDLIELAGKIKALGDPS